MYVCFCVFVYTYRELILTYIYPHNTLKKDGSAVRSMRGWTDVDTTICFTGLYIFKRNCELYTRDLQFSAITVIYPIIYHSRNPNQKPPCQAYSHSNETSVSANKETESKETEIKIKRTDTTVYNLKPATHPVRTTTKSITFQPFLR